MVLLHRCVQIDGLRVLLISFLKTLVK